MLDKISKHTLSLGSVKILKSFLLFGTQEKPILWFSLYEQGDEFIEITDVENGQPDSFLSKWANDKFSEDEIIQRVFLALFVMEYNEEGLMKRIYDQTFKIGGKDLKIFQEGE